MWACTPQFTAVTLLKGNDGILAQTLKRSTSVCKKQVQVLKINKDEFEMISHESMDLGLTCFACEGHDRKLSRRLSAWRPGRPAAEATWPPAGAPKLCLKPVLLASTAERTCRTTNRQCLRNIFQGASVQLDCRNAAAMGTTIICTGETTARCTRTHRKAYL